MDTLDNANNPFAIPNKTNNVVDRITTQTEDGLLLDFAEELKKNDDLPNNDLIKMLEKSNCGRLTPDFDKEDNLGPETNVDNPDDGPVSPNFDTMKRQAEALNNNQNCNPFNDIEKSLELNLNLKAGTFEGLAASPTEEECVPPANSVHNASQLIDAGAESDSEEDEEWNYVRGEVANKENSSPLQLSSQVAEEEAEDLEDAMSQLNPNAAEFIPSPSRVVVSPLGRLLDEDHVISRSPKKPPPTEVDINVPNQSEFEKDISQKPHEMEEAFSNGHGDGFNNETSAINALNSRLDEFHFGPNAAPFTPSKLLDQSEASSTRANYGDDESEMTLGTSFNDSMLSQDQNDFVQKNDPMSMSFHQDRTDDSSPFDLNKVHVLPEDVDAFIANKEESNNPLFDDTISDLTEHYPLGNPVEQQQTKNEFITDLDHIEKEIDSLQLNQSSTPKDERSQSPSDTNISVEDDRVLSPRDEIITPHEEDRVVSPREEIITPLEEDRSVISPEECKMPQVEEQLVDVHGDAECRLQSPYDQQKLSSPFENDTLISPAEERKSPYEDKELYSTQEEKDVCSPVEEKDVCFMMPKPNEPQNEEKEVFEEKDLMSEKDIMQEDKFVSEDKQVFEDKDSVAEKEVIEEKIFEEKEEITQRETFSPVEAIASPDSARDVTSPMETEQIISPQETTEDFVVKEKDVMLLDTELEIASQKTEEAMSSLERIASPQMERQSDSPLQDWEVVTQATIERDITSPVDVPPVQESPVPEKETVTSSQEECSLVRETVESPSLEEEVSTAELDEESSAPIKPSESIGELATEPVEVTTTCDILESPKREEQVVSEQLPEDEEFLKLETEKSDEEKAKENVENLLQLDNSNNVLSPAEEPSSILPEESITVNEPSKIDSLSGFGSESEVQFSQSEVSPSKEESTEQSGAPLHLDIDASNVDLHSQPTLEADKIVTEASIDQCSMNTSSVITSSFNTTSFLEEVKNPVTPHVSVSDTSGATCDTSSIVRIDESLNISQSSPVRELKPNSANLTSTPVADKLQAKSPAGDKATKITEKKTTTAKSASTTAAKKAPLASKSTTATSKTTTKAPLKPAARTISKTTPTTTASSKLSNSKTESAVSKVAGKTSTSTTTKASSTSNRVPISSRTASSTTAPRTNGTTKPATAKPTTGAIKKTSVEGSSVKSATTTGASRVTSTARSTLTSARSATSTAAAPRPRPTTLKPATTKTVDTPKPATARSTTAPRVPLSSRTTTAAKPSSSLASKDAKTAAAKPKSVTDKQVKETANKLTAASRTVTKTTSSTQSQATRNTAPRTGRGIEVTGTKTTTTRTTTAASRAPIKKPSDTTKTATTKVGKPKQNGVAPVVDEKLIVNTAPMELNPVTTNGEEQFVKDISPVDNKLITDNLSEPAAN